MEINPDLPPVEDEEMGVMGLTQVDPSPEKETEEMRGIRRMNTLGLRLGDHGTAWWRTYSHWYEVEGCNADIAL